MASSTSEPKPRAAPLGLTPARREAAITAFSRLGVYARVAEHLGVCESTLRKWKQADAEFRAELEEAGRTLDLTIGQLGRSALYKELAAFLAGEPVREQVATKNGRVLTLVQPRPLNVAAVRLALTKLDPTWTHPKQETELTLKTAGELIDELPE